MDPNATMGEFYGALNGGDARGAMEAIDTMTVWLRRGGYIPMGFDTASDVIDHMKGEYRAFDRPREC